MSRPLRAVSTLAFMALLSLTALRLAAEPAYPILLVHGINSSEEVWDDLVPVLLARYGATAADERPLALEANLNLDGSQASNNLSVRNLELGTGPSTADIGIDFRSLADTRPYSIYRLSFEFGPSGNLSNQEAIVKQGVALREAIRFITDTTRKEKVILVTHSMGGLAARAYLQWGRTSQSSAGSLWVSSTVPGGHRVAKLVTLGTPHNGSQLAQAPLPIDPFSNAARDLVYHYGLTSSFAPHEMNPSDTANGVFLYGGSEEAVPSGYYSYDINCNGTRSTSVTGLNDRFSPYRDNPLMPLPDDMDYFWIIGHFYEDPDSDGLVRADRQYLTPRGESKVIHACHAILICGACIETKATGPIIEALDEPDLPTRAWRLVEGQPVDAFITHQGDAASATDHDEFFLEVSGSGRATVSIPRSPVALTARISDGQGQTVAQASGFAPLQLPFDFHEAVSRRYRLEITGTGTAVDWDDACGTNAGSTAVSSYRIELTVRSTLLALSTSSPTVPIGGAATIRAQVKWQNDETPAAGVDVTFRTDHPGSFSGCTPSGNGCIARTDSGGAAVAGFSSAVEGNAAIQATAASGGAGTIDIAFARAGLAVSASPNPVPVNQPSTLSVTLTDGGGNPAPAGRTVTFSTSHPGFFTGNGATSTTSPSSVLTDSTGRTWIRFTSSVTGTARITIESGSATAAVMPVEIYNPNSSLNVQITAGFVSGTASSSTYEIQAVVTNASGQPVAGEPVTFTTSRGTLSASRDFTGPSGIADVNLTLTASGEVTVTATAGGNTAATGFQAQVGGSGSGPMSPIRTFTLISDIYGVGFTPDGSTLIAASYGRDLKAWSTSDWSAKWSRTATDTRLGQLSISPDGSKFLVAADDGVQVHQVSDGGWICESTNSEDQHYLGTWISSSSFIDTSFIRLYRYSSCSPGFSIATLPATGDTFERGGHLDFSPTRGWVAGATDEGNVFVYTTSGGKITQQVVSPGANASDTDFSTNGSKLAVAGWQSVKVFDTNTWSATAYGFQGLGDFKYSIAFIDNDTKLAVGGDGKVEVVDLATGTSLRLGTVSGRAWEMAWNQATGHLAVGTGSGNLYVFAPLAPVDTQAPTLSIAVPGEGQVTGAATIITTGRVSDNTAVTSFTISGTSVPLDATGGFSHTVGLAPGANTLVYSATDAAGNTASAQRTVTRTVDTAPPVISAVSVNPQAGVSGTPFTISSTVVDGDSGVALVSASIVAAGGTQVATLALTRGAGDTFSAVLGSAGLPTGPYRVDLSAVDSSPNVNTRTVTGAASFSVSEPPPPGLDFYTVQPCRAADTRTGAALTSQISRYIRLAGLCGIPTSARSVSVNITVVTPTGGGHVTLWPADLTRPVTSSINFSAGQIRANNAILPLATDGLGDVAAEAFVIGGGSVHLVIDVNGYFQ